MKPKVSIVMPIYNVSKYLKEALDSVVNQTLKDIEIICVNDGSTDNSLDVINEYANRDKRIKVIDKINTGYGHSMNIGIDNATGEYLGILEPDDYIKLDMYEKLYNIANKENLDVVKADFYRVTSTKDGYIKDYQNICFDKKYYRKIIDPSTDKKVFKFIINTWTGIYSMKFINKFNIRHNETPGASFQDNGFWFQTFCYAKRIYFVNEAFYHYRIDNPNSSVKDKNKIFIASNEYDFIYNILSKNSDLKDRYVDVYAYKRYENISITMNRIDSLFWPEILKHERDKFKYLNDAKELKKDIFPKYDWKKISDLLEDPKKFINSSIYDKFLRLVDCLQIYGIKHTINIIIRKLK